MKQMLGKITKNLIRWFSCCQNRSQNMEESGEQLTDRLEVAEEAVKIVRKYNSSKWKHDQQKGLVELCTDIAGILDAKRR